MVLDKSIYVDKMMTILNDHTKFELDDVLNDQTELEKMINNELQMLLKGHLITAATMKSLRPRDT